MEYGNDGSRETFLACKLILLEKKHGVRPSLYIYDNLHKKYPRKCR